MAAFMWVGSMVGESCRMAGLEVLPHPRTGWGNEHFWRVRMPEGISGKKKQKMKKRVLNAALEYKGCKMNSCGCCFSSVYAPKEPSAEVAEFIRKEIERTMMEK